LSAVSWNSPLAQTSSQAAQTTTSTKEILMGDSNGNIYECVIDASAGGESETSAATAALRTFSRGGSLERHFKMLFSLSEKANPANNTEYTITGIRSEIWSAVSGAQQRRRAVVIATTRMRLYQFVGTVPSGAVNVSIADRDEGGMYDELFKAYRDMTPSTPLDKDWLTMLIASQSLLNYLVMLLPTNCISGNQRKTRRYNCRRQLPG